MCQPSVNKSESDRKALELIRLIVEMHENNQRIPYQGQGNAQEHLNRIVSTLQHRLYQELNQATMDHNTTSEQLLARTIYRLQVQLGVTHIHSHDLY